MGTPISEDEFADLFRRFHSSAFRLETREYYAMSYEREAFHRFLKGHPQPPSALPWWQDWLNQMQELTHNGKRIGRVRIMSEPPTDYQRWEMWGTPFHVEVGEEIHYLSRSAALALHVPLDEDWWLFDDTRLVIMQYTSAGEIDGKTLITDPGVIARYCGWRDLAVSHATTAGSFAAV